MAGSGFTHEAIAACLGTEGIDPKTLRLHFRRELDTASTETNAKVAKVALQKALQGESWAVCFWLKCRAGWVEPQKMQHSGDADAPIKVQVEYVTESAKVAE